MSESDADCARPRGLFDSLKDVLATIMALAQTRLELVGTELEEQVARLAILLVWSIVALLLVFIGVKMLLYDVVHMPVWVSLVVIAAVGGGAVAASLWQDRRHRIPAADPPDDTVSADHEAQDAVRT